MRSDHRWSPRRAVDHAADAAPVSVLRPRRARVRTLDELRAQQLDHDLALELGILGEQDDAHPTAAQLALDLIAVDARVDEVVERPAPTARRRDRLGDGIRRSDVAAQPREL